MKPQRFQFGDQPWPISKGVLQVYAPVNLASNPALRVLVDQARAAMQGAPVTLLDDQHLHTTLDVVAGVTAELVSQVERDELAAALRARISRMPAYHGSAGSCLAYVSGPVIDISPAAPLIEVQAAVREVIRTVRGDRACTWRQTKPHISLGYAHTATDSDPWARRLRQIDPNHVPLHITSVALVDVRPDHHTKRLDWTAVTAPIPLSDA